MGSKTKVRKADPQAEVLARAGNIGASSVMWRPSEFEPEQADHLLSERTKTTKTVKRIAVIKTMRTREQIDEERYHRLSYYREQALLADSSPVRSCLDRSISSGGEYSRPVEVVSAELEVARIERDMGSLTPIARAVAVEDKSLSEWCVDQFGGRERYDGKGRFVAIVPVNETARMRMALQDLKMAADRIVPC